ncbi:hypothetical protein P7C70_g2618, partial [Phenoliferia sp. Uapishka_3]
MENNNVPFQSIPPPNGQALDVMEKANLTPMKRSLRIAIISENFLPNFACVIRVDGVTRTLAMLLEHLQLEGHTALVMGPESGMTSYAGHEVVGTKGIPLLGVYKGLKLNFIRPKFIRRLRESKLNALGASRLNIEPDAFFEFAVEFKPDVIQFVDPIWLCAQCIPAIQYYLPDTPLLTSYHTNLAMYATLFGFPWLTPIMWNLQRNLHGRCALTYCPSPSTARMLESNGFKNVRLWPRGVDTGLFRPEARCMDLRRSWGAEPSLPSTPPRRSSLDRTLTPTPNPPPYSSTASKIVLLYVGRISWEKNLRLLVEAARGLQVASQDGTRPACQLVFVGDGPSRPELEAICTKYGLDAVFMGYRKGEELAAAYASADIFVFPSWWVYSFLCSGRGALPTIILFRTETFGQVVLESLASGLPVVGLRAEGVCDLVKDGETGLLLDLDDLLPSTSAATMKCPESPSLLPPYSPTPAFRPLPENPHALVDVNSPTFPLAVSLYRALIVEVASNHSRRQMMGVAAATDASRRSWHGAMEMLVDGYRDIATPVPKPSLSLSRTSTIELDVVEHCADTDTYAESTAADSRAKRRMLKFSGVFRRTGGRLKEGSISIPLRGWLGRNQGKFESLAHDRVSELVAAKPGQFSVSQWVLKIFLLSCVFYFVSIWLVGVPTFTSLQDTFTV